MDYGFLVQWLMWALAFFLFGRWTQRKDIQRNNEIILREHQRIIDEEVQKMRDSEGT